jgi:hypothetical protein
VGAVKFFERGRLYCKEKSLVSYRRRDTLNDDYKLAEKARAAG